MMKSDAVQRIEKKMANNEPMSALEMAIFNSADRFPSTANGAAQELEKLMELGTAVEEHCTRYNNNGTDYWTGRRDEAIFFRDLLRSLLKPTGADES